MPRAVRPCLDGNSKVPVQQGDAGSAMDLHRFVQIICQDKSGAHSGGTGYLLHGDRVITARHVVDGAAAVEVRFDRVTASEVQKQSARVVWRGEDDLDVAILEVKTGQRLARQIVATGRLAEDRPWRTRGWAEVAEANGPSVVDNMVSLWGKAMAHTDTTRRFEISIEAAPQKVTDWSGVSGAPVFCDRRLVGILTDGLEAFDGRRLKAVPLALLWQDEEFRSKAGYERTVEENRQSRRRDIETDLRKLLEQDALAARAIATEGPESWQQLLNGEDGYSKLAATLCDAPSWREILEVFDRAHQRMMEGDAEEQNAAAVIEQILARVLPEVYWATSMSVLPGNDGGQLVSLPVETSTLAEIAMAALENRSYSFKAVVGMHDYPEPTAKFQKGDTRSQRKGEVGFDFGSQEAFFRWVLMLARWMKIDTADLEELSRAERFEELLPHVDQRLAKEVGRYKLPRRYFLFTDDFAHQRRGFLKRVEVGLPSLGLTHLTGKSRISERDACESLQAILFRSYNARKKKK